MNGLRLKPAMKYVVYTGSKAIGIFFAIMILVMLSMTVIFAALIGRQNQPFFAGLGLGGSVMMFVLGLMVVRENLKLFLQNGCGRRTVFVTDILGSVIFALTMTLASKLLGLIFSASLISFDIIGMNMGGSLPVSQTLALQFCLLLLLWRFGAFTSLVYYRLNRLGQIAVSIIVPAALFIGLPVAADRGLIAPEIFSACFSWLIASPYHFMLVALTASLLFSAGLWPLLLRAPVKE